MQIDIIDVKSRKDLREFIFLPEKIHKGHKNWVPPIYMDEKRYFNSEKNKSFSYCDTTMKLAYKGKELVGRIMGIINNRYNEVRKEQTARFGYLETIEEQEVVCAFLNSIESWARDHGMREIVGPYGFTDQDPEGFLIEGFENRATIATYYNYAWMPRFVERQGYTKDVDYIVYKIEIPKELPGFYKRIYERLKRRGTFEIIEFSKRRELKKWVKPILSLMNKCYIESSIYGYAPLDDKEIEELGKRYLPIIDPRFVKGVIKDGELVSFIIGIPDMTEGIQKVKGRLFPLKFLKILRAEKETRQLDLLLGGIDKKFRGIGLDVLMGSKMIMSAHEAGMEIIDTHHELESNLKVRAEMEKMGGKIYKRFRIYRKNL